MSAIEPVAVKRYKMVFNMKFSLFNSTKSQDVVKLFNNVFSDSEGKEEGKLIWSLVSELIDTTNKEDLLGFVACSEESVVGSIFFSRMLLSDDRVAFILSPVAIETNSQGKGLGQKLINYGINHLRSLHVDFVFTYGDPNFYSKVGFKKISEDVIKAPFKLSHPEGWLAQSLNETSIEVLNCTTKCVSALSNEKYW